MIKLEADQLSFGFPEINKRLRRLLSQWVNGILPKFLGPDERVGPLKEHRSRPGFRPLAEERLDRHRLRALNLTAEEIKLALRAAALRISGIGDKMFPTVTISFQRTLRIPDDGATYPLPASLGRFPLRSVDDFPETAPESWLKRGGVALPMHQSEALWIRFSSQFPFAVKIAAGKINAVSGEQWNSELHRDPQDYLVVPKQPWLDGFSVGKGLIRQFVAMPLGAGYSVEEQITGEAHSGGIQFQVFPFSADKWFHRNVVPSLPSSLTDLIEWLYDEYIEEHYPAGVTRNLPYPLSLKASMGLGAGGRMRQEIYQDPHEFADWDQTKTRRCFIHLCNSLVWRQVTGMNPPHPPLTAKEYKQGRIPWFDYYRDDLKPLKGSKRLAGVKSVAQLGKEKNSQPLPENSSIAPELIVQYGNTRRPGEIREFFDTP